MDKNNSPWLHQLNRTRELKTLQDNFHEADLAIIGGGIAGIATAYFCLKNTDKKIVLIEGSKIAHGASGHNGGFLANYFERSFYSLVSEFGLELAAQAAKDMEYSWQLLDEIRLEVGLKTPMWQFTGYAGLIGLNDLLIHLENNFQKKQAGLASSLILVSNIADYLNQIPEQYKDLYTILPSSDILDLLETDDIKYTAVLPERKGCMNSAMFCEELAEFLLKNYTDRLFLFEDAWVKRLVLKKDHAILDTTKKSLITANEVVLCTNGFEKINIVNTAGQDIDKKFHYLVRGIVGYMAGYTEELNKPPTEISYLPEQIAHNKDIFEEEPYFYLTRRPYELEQNQKHNLICIGGPELLLDDTKNYNQTDPYSEVAKKQIDDFLNKTYRHVPKDNIHYKFLWHGLMGFTPNGVRLIGPEPRNKILFYNLGCNGVGLLPSIFGGYKISKFVAKQVTKPSIFDPK